MDRSLLGHLDRAFELAYFLHTDRRLALEITVEAMSMVEALATAQDKRRYYRLAGRKLAGLGGARRQRSRVSMSKAQLLQRLLYTVSEPHERHQEAAGERLEEDTMTARYIAFLVRICLRRNAFHLAVGCGRLLHAYPTGEVLALYDLVAQDPERLRDPDYFRARKRQLLGELRRRFGARLKMRRGRRGELRFETRQTDGALRRLVARCLERMTPWETRCTVPERFPATSCEIEALRFRGSNPDEEHAVEMDRIHALLHPPCLGRLTRALGLAPPEERLAVPMLGRDDGPGGGDRPRGRRDHPPELTEADRHAVEQELERREDLRRRLSSGVLRVLVDKVEAARWEVLRSRSCRLVVAEGSELVEVVAREQGEEVLLAAYLLPPLAGTGGPPPRASLRLPGAHRFDFTLTVPRAGEPGGARLEILLQESPLRRAMRLAGSPVWARPRRLWRPAGALALLALALFGASLLLEAPAPPPPVPPRIRGMDLPAVGLAGVKRVFVDPLGAGPFAEELRAHLLEALAAPAARAEADAVLMRDPGRMPPWEAEGKLALRLVNARGEVLWRGLYRAPSDPAAEVAARMAADLEAARERARGAAQEP